MKEQEKERHYLRTPLHKLPRFTSITYELYFDGRLRLFILHGPAKHLISMIFLLIFDFIEINFIRNRKY